MSGDGKDREAQSSEYDRKMFRVLFGVVLVCGIVLAGGGIRTFATTGTGWGLVSIVSGVVMTVCAFLLLRRYSDESS